MIIRAKLTNRRSRHLALLLEAAMLALQQSRKHYRNLKKGVREAPGRELKIKMTMEMIKVTCKLSHIY